MGEEVTREEVIGDINRMSRNKDKRAKRNF